MAVGQYSLFPSPASASSNPSVGINGTTAPTSSTEVGGVGVDGNLHPLSTDNSGVLNVNVTAGPPGNATAANQVLQIAQETGIHADTTAINGKLNSLGQKTMANSMPVAIASDQSAIPASQSGAWTTARTWTLSSGTDSVNVGNFPATQPVSGTVTANQGTSPWVNNISQFGGSAVVTGTGASGAGIPRVTVANDSNILATQSGTWNIGTVTTVSTVSAVTAITNALPAGANTIGAVTQASGPWTQNLTQVGGSSVTLGQKTSANSVPVVLASDQSSINTVSGGHSKVTFARNDYTSTAVTTAAYVQIIASTSATSNLLEIFDSSGETLVLAIGAAASEVDQFYINPGGNGQIPFLIPSGSRVSIKAVTATASVGYFNLNLYS